MKWKFHYQSSTVDLPLKKKKKKKLTNIVQEILCSPRYKEKKNEGKWTEPHKNVEYY